MALLEVAGLTVRFATPDGEVAAVNGIDFEVAAGETLGLVGESGSGKSQTVLAMMGLLASNGRTEGSVRLDGQEILGLPTAKLNHIRGSKVAMIFQDPMTCLNPYLTVRRQLTEVLVQHRGMSERAALAEAVAMLDRVQIPEPRKRIDSWPHEFSGGMRQRVMIAMALLCRPALLIADEPTTALDVTVQAAILDLLRGVGREFGMAIILITHNLGVVAGLADRMAVLYGGRIVEQGGVEALFEAPAHPYTAGLLGSTPRLDAGAEVALVPIPGAPPNLQHLPSGCAFRPRCVHAWERCAAELPPLYPVEAGRASACHLVPA